MAIRLLAAATGLLLGTGLVHSREATTPETQARPAAATTDPLDVPRGVRDWFAKSVDGILDERSAPEGRPAEAEKPVPIR